MLLQQGKADAITGDDTVLAGLAAQDPNTVITSAKAITVEPYGLGFNKADVYLVRYVNRVIADLVADGQWKAIYNRWLAAAARPGAGSPDPRLRALMTAAPLSTPDQSGAVAPTAPGRARRARAGRRGPDVPRTRCASGSPSAAPTSARSTAPCCSCRRPSRSPITTDLTVALTFWKAVSDRLTLLETTFDGGRVGPGRGRAALDPHPRPARLQHLRAPLAALERLARGEPARGVPAARLADPHPPGPRLAGSRRCRGVAANHRGPGRGRAHPRPGAARARPAPSATTPPRSSPGSTGASRTCVARARRGADVGGVIGPLEIDIAVLERDLIVAAAERASAARSRVRTQQQIEELDARAAAIRALERACIEAITPAPHLAIPNVRALGPVPQAAAELAAYRERLERVSRALDLAHERYAAGLAERDEVVGLAGALSAMAASARVPDELEPDLTDLRRRLDETLARTPPAARAGPRPRRRLPVLPRRRHAFHAPPPEGSPMKCTQPGCSGTIVDGYCDVCGMAASSPGLDRALARHRIVGRCGAAPAGRRATGPARDARPRTRPPA